MSTRRTLWQRIAAPFWLCLGLGACAAGAPVDHAGPDGVPVVFADFEAPEVFQLEGRGERLADDAAGHWAVAPGLPRPERGLVRNLDSGAETTVALFSGRAGASIGLSQEAADALGIAANGSAPVVVVALRREPRIAGRDGF